MIETDFEEPVGPQESRLSPHQRREPETAVPDLRVLAARRDARRGDDATSDEPTAALEEKTLLPAKASNGDRGAIQKCVDSLQGLLKRRLYASNQLEPGLYLDLDAYEAMRAGMSGNPFFLVCTIPDDKALEAIAVSAWRFLTSEFFSMEPRLGKWLSGSICQLLSSVFRVNPEEVQTALLGEAELAAFLVNRGCRIDDFMEGEHVTHETEIQYPSPELGASFTDTEESELRFADES